MDTSLNLGKYPIANMIPKIPSLEQIQHKVQGIPILEGIVHINQKRRATNREQYPLIHDTHDALLGDDSGDNKKHTWT